MNKWLVRDISLLLLPSLLVDPALAPSSHPSTNSLAPSYSVSVFEQTALAAEALHQAHAIDNPIPPAALRQFETTGLDSQRTLGMARKAFLVWLASLGAYAQDQKDKGDFTGEEEQLIQNEVDAFLDLNVPALKEQRVGIIGRFRQHWSLSLDTWVRGVWAMMSVAVMLCFARALQDLANYAEGKPVGRRLFFYLLAGAGFWQLSGTLTELLGPEFRLYGLFDANTGSAEIATQRLSSNVDKRFAIAHESFHFIGGATGLYPRHKLFANAYALLRVFDAEGMEGLESLLSHSNYAGHRADYFIGSDVYDEFHDPALREEALITRIMSHFPEFTFDPNPSFEFDWVYAYGVATGAVAIRLAQAHGLPFAYRYLGARSQGINSRAAEEFAQGRHPLWTPDSALMARRLQPNPLYRRQFWFRLLLNGVQGLVTSLFVFKLAERTTRAKYRWAEWITASVSVAVFAMVVIPGFLHPTLSPKSAAVLGLWAAAIAAVMAWRLGIWIERTRDRWQRWKQSESRSSFPAWDTIVIFGFLSLLPIFNVFPFFSELKISPAIRSALLLAAAGLTIRKLLIPGRTNLRTWAKAILALLIVILLGGYFLGTFDNLFGWGPLGTQHLAAAMFEQMASILPMGVILSSQAGWLRRRRVICDKRRD